MYSRFFFWVNIYGGLTEPWISQRRDRYNIGVCDKNPLFPLDDTFCVAACVQFEATRPLEIGFQKISLYLIREVGDKSFV